jgi:conjugative transfer region lipoprotein (TIGR03751 family)
MTCSTDRFPSLRPAAGAALALLLAGCASGPGEQDRLPDEGPTTLEVYERHMAGLTAGDPATAAPVHAARTTGVGCRTVAVARSTGAAVAPEASADSRAAQTALDDLRRDFQRIPNPDLLGYVYPHLAGDLPVPGYYTVFPLREATHYAQPGEGSYGETRP